MKIEMLGGFIALFLLMVMDFGAVAAEFIDAKEEIAATNIGNVTKDVEDSGKLCATCYKVGDYCYNRSRLFELRDPFGKAVVINKMGIFRDDDSNVLYYSYLPPVEDPEKVKIGYVSLKNSSLSGVILSNKAVDMSTFDINQNSKKIYIGSSNGIWFTDPTQSPPEPQSPVAISYTVTNVISKNFLYFTSTHFAGIYKLKNDVYIHILDGNPVKNFVVDRDFGYNVVYLNTTGLYAINSVNDEEVKLHKNAFFRGLTLDCDGIVYAWNVDGIYRVYFDEIYSKSVLKKVSDLEVGAMTFDEYNNIIYNEGKILYRLKKIGENC